jgi:hypothetical protein
MRHLIKSLSNIHHPSSAPNVFIFSTPRSGSTWVEELIWSQPGFKSCDEPLNLRNPLVRRSLGIDDWRTLYGGDAQSYLEPYFRAFCEGRLGFLNPNPLRKYYRPLTYRIVFKVLHGGEDRINWFRDTYNGRIVLLIRHPIPVALSREVHPRLDTFVNGPYRAHFADGLITHARRIFERGTDLERGVLSWCFQNALPLREATDDWVVVSYEQMVLDPAPAIKALAHKLDLPRPDRMLKRLTVPSAVKPKSDPETQRMLENEEREALVGKWRRRVSGEQEGQAMQILEVFGIDAYHCGALAPASRWWIQ